MNKKCYLEFQNSASLTDSGISESGDNECEEALLSKLRSLAQDLQQQLTPKSNIIQEITQVSSSSCLTRYCWDIWWMCVFICMFLILILNWKDVLYIFRSHLTFILRIQKLMVCAITFLRQYYCMGYPLKTSNCRMVRRFHI